MTPLVSILVPIYGVEKYIERCARSLFEQTYKSIEFIFVNDCTPDDSVSVLNEVLLSYPERAQDVRVINHVTNKGLSGARNTGLEVAHGDFLLFVDSDDYIDKNAVEKLVNTALSSGADIVAYNTRYIYNDREFIVGQKIKTQSKEYVCQLLTYQAGVTIWGKLIKRDLFINNNVRFIEGLNFGEDYVTSPRVAYYASRIVHCPDVYYNYVQYNDSSYTMSYCSKNIDDLIRALGILQAFFLSKDDYPYFKDAIEEAYLHNKVKLLIAICLHYKKVGHRLKEVSELYFDKHSLSHNLSRSYKVLLWLSKHRLNLIMRIYVLLGYKVKQLIKK